MNTNLKAVLVVGGGVALVSVAFWAGMATRRRSDVGNSPGSALPACRSGNMAVSPATKPRALTRLVKTARAAKDENGTRVAPANQAQRTDPVNDEGVHSALLAVLDGLDKGRINEQEAVRRIRELKGTDDGEFLSCLREMSADGDAGVRIRALALIEAAYGSDGSPLVIDLDADPSPEEVDQDAHRTHELVVMVGEGLRDSDKSVRDAAFDVFSSLNGDPSFVLSRQILMGDDHDQKMKLMDAMANTVTTYALGLSLDALGNADGAVRDAAARNLAAVTGKTFTSQDEARAWWEANCDAFMERANGSPDMNAASMAESLGLEDNNSGQETNPKQNQAKEQEQ